MKLLDQIYRYAMIPVKRYRTPQGKPPVFLFGFHKWKTFMEDWLPGTEIRRYDGELKRADFIARWRPWLLSDRRAKVYVWSYRSPDFLDAFCARHRIPLIRVEDGFLRSVALGAQQAEPVSMTFAEKAAYFDATTRSDLEELIETYDFAADPELLERARRGMERLIRSRLSKYNVGSDRDITEIYGPKTKKRILVVGQVEGDMSMMKGMASKLDNNKLVQLVARQNPDAQIIYKPHPEVLRGIRRNPPQSDPHEVSGMAQILTTDITLADAFRTVDRVCTMTSLSGFEALIRGIPVTCYGMPFYAGWGLTRDRVKCPRRTARRTIEEVFAAAYILHPRYMDPTTGKRITFEEALDLLAWMRDHQPPARAGEAEPGAREAALEDALLGLDRALAAVREKPRPEAA